MSRHFTSPLYPGVPAPQNPAEWPELSASTIEKFNKWYDPEIQKEIKRRAEAAMSMDFQDSVYFPHMDAWARMELVRYARLHRDENVSLALHGFHGGMKLESENAEH